MPIGSKFPFEIITEATQPTFPKSPADLLPVFPDNPDDRCPRCKEYDKDGCYNCGPATIARVFNPAPDSKDPK